MNKKTVTIIVTVLLGLLVGSMANSFLDSGGINGVVEEIKYTLPMSVTVTEDPDLDSYTVEAANYSNDVRYTDLKIKGAGEQRGPWRGIVWTEVPPQLTDPDMKGSVLLTNDLDGLKTKANIYQITRLPDQEMKLVMKARNPAEAMGLDTSKCSTSKGFVSIKRWNGPVPVIGLPSPSSLVKGSKKRVNQTFGPSDKKMVIDVPDRFEGEKVSFFGGLSAERICDGPAATLLEIDELYITTK